MTGEIVAAVHEAHVAADDCEACGEFHPDRWLAEFERLGYLIVHRSGLAPLLSPLLREVQSIDATDETTDPDAAAAYLADRLVALLSGRRA